MRTIIGDIHERTYFQLCDVKIISVFLANMRAKRPIRKTYSPAQALAKTIQKKNSRGYPLSPTKSHRAKQALFEIAEGVSIRDSAKKYGLSYSFLQRRSYGAVEWETRNGPLPILNAFEEDLVADYLSEMALRGMGLKAADVLDLVQNFLEQEKRTNPFKDSRPGYVWFYSFMDRHQDKIETRKENVLEQSRAKETE